MKFRRVAAALTAAVMAFSFGGCLKYSGDLLDSTQNRVNNPTGSNDFFGNTTSRFDSPDNTEDITGSIDSPVTLPEDNTKVNRTDPNNDVTKRPETPTSSDRTDNNPTEKNPVKPPKTEKTNGYDIMKSGTFYWKGKMLDPEGNVVPAEMASTKNSLYMSTNLNGASVGILIQGKNSYIIYPKIKGYMNMKALMTVSGMGDDLFTLDAIDFDGLGTLDDATSTYQTNFNNKNCTAYVFNDDGGTTEVFMSGSSFIGMRSTDSRGNVLSAIYVDYLTNKVPADKCAPPSNYTEYSGIKVVSFVKELMNDMNLDV